VAHLGFFRTAFVEKRKWFTDAQYADLVALCQFLPGPSSSQVGFGIGVKRAGLSGGVAAFIGFTLPSMLFLMVVAALASMHNGLFSDGVIHGLKLAAAAIVANALLGMATSLCKTRISIVIAIAALFIAAVWQNPLNQIIAILVGCAIGFALEKADEQPTGNAETRSIKGGNIALIAFALLLFGASLLAALLNLLPVEVFDRFYRSGALVFGGGHVVLPLLENEVVGTGLIDRDQFLAGYGVTQAVPGPIFSFAAYLGMLVAPFPGNIGYALLATIAIFLPGFLLLYGLLSHWHKWENNQAIKRIMIGANAAVVGVLGAAFYDPIWTSTIFRPLDFSLFALGFVLLRNFNIAPWALVLGSGILGALLNLA
jgi:chromate transporter